MAEPVSPCDGQDYCLSIATERLSTFSYLALPKLRAGLVPSADHSSSLVPWVFTGLQADVLAECLQPPVTASHADVEADLIEVRRELVRTTLYLCHTVLSKATTLLTS